MNFFTINFYPVVFFSQDKYLDHSSCDYWGNHIHVENVKQVVYQIMGNNFVELKYDKKYCKRLKCNWELLFLIEHFTRHIITKHTLDCSATLFKLDFLYIHIQTHTRNNQQTFNIICYLKLSLFFIYVVNIVVDFFLLFARFFLFNCCWEIIAHIFYWSISIIHIYILKIWIW